MYLLFSGAPVKCFFPDDSNNSDSVVFGNAGFEETKIPFSERHLFRNIFFYDASLQYVSTLRKKVFSGAPVKCFFLYGSNKSDSVVFVKPVLEKSKIRI